MMGGAGRAFNSKHLLWLSTIFISIPRTQTREIQVPMDLALKYANALGVPEVEFLQSLTPDPTGMLHGLRWKMK